MLAIYACVRKRELSKPVKLRTYVLYGAQRRPVRHSINFDNPRSQATLTCSLDHWILPMHLTEFLHASFAPYTSSVSVSWYVPVTATSFWTCSHLDACAGLLDLKLKRKFHCVSIYYFLIIYYSLCVNSFCACAQKKYMFGCTIKCYTKVIVSLLLQIHI